MQTLKKFNFKRYKFIYHISLCLLLSLIVPLSFAAQYEVRENTVFINKSTGSSSGDLSYWRLDASNDPPTSEWDMGNFGFDNLGLTTMTGNLQMLGNNINGSGNNTANYGFFDYIGINQTNPSHTLDIIGDFLLTHTATTADEHGLELKIDADGIGDIKGIDLVYDTGAISTGLDEEAILINFDTSSATGGSVAGLEVLRTGNTAEVHALLAGIEIDPILQFTGVFGNMDSVDNNGDDDLAEFISTTSNVTIFASDNDYVTIGNAEHFEEIEFILDLEASRNIKPTFEFSTGIGAWDDFTPTDGTNGLENSGVIIWENSDIPSWATGAGTEYLIRITRTKNNINTAPIENLVQISDVTEYSWDKLGDLKVHNITANKINASNVTINDVQCLPSNSELVYNHTEEVPKTEQAWTVDQTFNDNVKMTFGTGGDADIYYDGVQLVINPKVVGSGGVKFDTDSKLLFRGSSTTLHSPSAAVLRYTVTGLGARHEWYTGASELMRVGSQVQMGGATNYIRVPAGGDMSFVGSAGFYPRFLTQADEPAAGTGATQLDTSEMCIWKDSDDSKVYIAFNDGGTVKTVELA